MAAPDAKYVDGIHTGLDAAFKRAERRPFDPARERIAIFSDLHRGVGDKADDFRRCEHAYGTALGYYLEAGYRLFLLGDAEELWEERAGPVIERYGDLFALEAQFADRLERFYGNHDDTWASKRQVAKHLGSITVREGLRLEVARPGGDPVTLFFVHGHQGRADSDRWAWVSRRVVRHVWRPLQRRFGFSPTTPARDYALRARHDRAMFEWARSRPDGLVLVAGHTHRPVFAHCVPDPPPTRPIEELERALSDAAGDRTAAAALRAELEYARAARRRPDRVLTVAPPCYFNSGCCSFPDGDATGLEIADGEIRLVRWPANLREVCTPGEGIDVTKRILATEDLEQVLAAVSGPLTAEAGIVEQEIGPA